MNTSRSYLRELATIDTIADDTIRRQVFRQGMAMLAAVSEREPSPLEGLDPSALQRSARSAIEHGLFDDMSWLSPSAAASALYEFSQAVISTSAERRELGRRVLSRLRHADDVTFVRLAIALARTAPKILTSEANYARAAHLFGNAATAGIAELALGVLAQPLLVRLWFFEPSTGPLIGRQCSARMLAHAAREAVSRSQSGDHGGVALLTKPAIRSVLNQLLTDREALVWRSAAIARGLLAHVDADYAEDISRELSISTSTNTELRRAAVSAVAAFERGGAAMAWWLTVTTVARDTPGIARSAVMGIAGFAAVATAQADELVCSLIHHCADDRLRADSCEAVAELCRDESPALLPRATKMASDFAKARLEASLRQPMPDLAMHGLYQALVIDLNHEDAVVRQGVLPSMRATRLALAFGDTAKAHAEAQASLAEFAEAIATLATADIEQERVGFEVTILREIDREILSDSTLLAALAAGSDDIEYKAVLRESLHQLEAVLVMREADDVMRPHDLRLVQLRAFIRLLDSAPHSDEASNRILAMQTLMSRAREDRSPLRRAVHVAMTRAADALLRNHEIDLTDLLLTWPSEFPHDEDFAVVREASMLDDMNAVFGRYLELQRQAMQPADASSSGHSTVCDCVAALAQALPLGVASRIEGVRSALTQLALQMKLLFRCHDRAEIADVTIDAISDLIGNLSLRIVGARQRLQLTALSNPQELEIEFRSIGRSIASARNTKDQAAAISLALEIDERVDLSVDIAQRLLPPGLAAVIRRLLMFLSGLPSKQDGILLVPTATEPGAHMVLPGWIPLSRRLGGFTVLRPIGSGAGGSVLLAVRSDQMKRNADPTLHHSPVRSPMEQTVALKVPDYDGGAARSMSEQEFETVFREEASALLSLPRHRNLAGFVTFDASAVPKPILVMEFVPGPNLEHVIDGRRLHMKRALSILDGILAGLSQMHASGLAHLDVKPPNVVLRSGDDEPVLVDFGLAGRRLRIGCGSPHYAAREVWLEPDATHPVIAPYAADVYAVACIAAELFTGNTLVTGDTLSDVVGTHLSGNAGTQLCQALKKNGLVDVALLLAGALDRDAAKRPTAEVFRRGLAGLTPQLSARTWPLA